MKTINSLTFLFFTSCCLAITACRVNTDDTQTIVIKPTGSKKNSLAALEKIPEADFDEDVMKTPVSFSLDGPPIINQGNTNKCVSFSGGYYILGMYNGLKSTSSSANAAGSVEFMHTQYKKINKDNCSEGAFMYDETNDVGMAEILETYGTCSWQQLPFVDSKTCTVIPSNLVSEAAKNKTGGFTRLDKSEFTNTEELKAWIYAGFPLWFAVDVDDNFQDLEGAAVWKSTSGTASGHAMVLVGWDDAKKAFKIANSWGKEWADKGYGWVDYDYFKKLLKASPSIGVIYPNDSQRAVFNKLSPASCGNAGWGDLFVENKRSEEIAIEMTGANNYINDDADNIDANEVQSFSGIPKGAIKIKIMTANKSKLIKEYTATIPQCDEVTLIVN